MREVIRGHQWMRALTKHGEAVTVRHSLRGGRRPRAKGERVVAARVVAARVVAARVVAAIIAGRARCQASLEGCPSKRIDDETEEAVKRLCEVRRPRRRHGLFM